MPKYHDVRDVWKENPHEPPTPVEAERGVRRLWRRFTGKKWEGPLVITSGRNYTYVRAGVLRVNPNQSLHFRGWAGIVHGLSHAVVRRVRPRDKPHSPWHVEMETEMARYVIEHNWHRGGLK